MKVIFTCGGTAGHVNPALALAGYMRKKDPTVEVLFVGTPEGIERDLVAQAGYDYRGIAVGSLERSVSWEAIRHNCKSAWEMLALRRKTGAILKEFPADLVVGTGGYASYPMVKYAALRGIPTAVHEAHMIPGLTTKCWKSTPRALWWALRSAGRSTSTRSALPSPGPRCGGTSLT